MNIQKARVDVTPAENALLTALAAAGVRQIGWAVSYAARVQNLEDYTLVGLPPSAEPAWTENTALTALLLDLVERFTRAAYGPSPWPRGEFQLDLGTRLLQQIGQVAWNDGDVESEAWPPARWVGLYLEEPPVPAGTAGHAAGGEVT